MTIINKRRDYMSAGRWLMVKLLNVKLMMTNIIHVRIFNQFSFWKYKITRPQNLKRYF